MPPSWLLSPFSRSSKQSPPPPSSSSSSSSSLSTPFITPISSTIWTSGEEEIAKPQKRLRRKRKNAQPGPILPRLSSLFFPTTQISVEQEDRCIYRASHAASLSDLLGGGRRVSGIWGGFGGGSKQTITALDNHSSFDLTPPISTYNNRYSRSVGDFSTLIESPTDPYLVLAPLYPSGRKQARKSVDYTTMLDAVVRKERSNSTSGGIERGTEIWSSPYDSETDLPSTSMAPPPVPARSTLRPTASASNLRDRAFKSASSTTPFTLPVDSLPTRPAFSPSTSERQSSPGETASRPPMTPSVSSTSTESAFSIGRKKRPAVRGGSISGDPNRIKDGAAARESTSGVYTPPTFLGPIVQHPPKPSSSRVYTPASFTALSPTISSMPLPSPSRSTSVSSTSTTSSAEVTTPRTPHTPLTPSSRFLGAVSGGWGSLKRASGALSARSAATPSPSYTPTSAREGYFPSTIYESAPSTTTGPSFWPMSSPGTPGSAGVGKPYGLGLGLGTGPEAPEYRRSRSDTVTSEKFGGVLVGEVPKGKRKPVPRPAGQEEIKEEDTDEGVGYAM